MSKECAVTGKRSLVGGRYSNRTRATQYNPCGKVRRHANLQKRKVYVPELDKTFSLTLSAKALKTIAKRGAYATLKKAGIVK
ncbi:MAG: bL28 family ribosomal protein [Patescibacteria group bacterium UBA2163]